MSSRINALLMSFWNGMVYTLRWIVALVRVAHRYAWRTKVAMFNAPALGNLEEFKRVYGNYHRSIVHLPPCVRLVVASHQSGFTA